MNDTASRSVRKTPGKLALVLMTTVVYEDWPGSALEGAIRINLS